MGKLKAAKETKHHILARFFGQLSSPSTKRRTATDLMPLDVGIGVSKPRADHRVPKTNPSVNWTRLDAADRAVTPYRAIHPSGKQYQLGAKEYLIAQSMRGDMSVDAMASKLAEEMYVVDKPDAVKTIHWMLAADLLRLDQQHHSESKSDTPTSVLSPFPVFAWCVALCEMMLAAAAVIAIGGQDLTTEAFAIAIIAAIPLLLTVGMASGELPVTISIHRFLRNWLHIGNCIEESLQLWKGITLRIVLHSQYAFPAWASTWRGVVVFILGAFALTWRVWLGIGLLAVAEAQVAGGAGWLLGIAIVFGVAAIIMQLMKMSIDHSHPMYAWRAATSATLAVVLLYGVWNIPLPSYVTQHPSIPVHEVNTERATTAMPAAWRPAPLQRPGGHHHSEATASEKVSIQIGMPRRVVQRPEAPTVGDVIGLLWHRLLTAA